MPETRVTTLANGLRVASEDYGLPTATVSQKIIIPYVSLTQLMFLIKKKGRHLDRCWKSIRD